MPVPTLSHNALIIRQIATILKKGVIELTGSVTPDHLFFTYQRKRELTGSAIPTNFLVSGERELTGSAISGAKLVFRYRRETELTGPGIP